MAKLLKDINWINVKKNTTVSHDPFVQLTAHTACVQSSSISTTYLTVDWLKTPAVLPALQDHKDETPTCLNKPALIWQTSILNYKPLFFQCCVVYDRIVSFELVLRHPDRNFE